MRGFTVSQPWAYAILHGKDIENRDWRSFPAYLLGQVIALHAGRPGSKWEFEADRGDIHRIDPALLVPQLSELPVKAIVGTFRVREAVKAHPSPWYNGSKLALVLTDVRAFAEPIYVNGQQGLWEVKPPEYQEMRRQAAAGQLRKVWTRDADGKVLRAAA